ncbi:MAG: pyridoxal phosphate-dependent aminotransferase [Euryarchaeota archaeon]|nr:pyridoxal phosphate-dependent aminotransferase [Euryarchaeota archaeon]
MKQRQVISARVRHIPQSATMKIADIAANLRREGRDIISFSQGEPDFETPANIKNAAKDALDRGETHYTQGSGILELREAIAEKLKTDNHLDVTSSDVLVTTGAKQAIFEAICTLIDEGDEVLLFDPAWVSYEPIVKFAGGKPVMVPVYERDDYAPVEFQSHITDDTKLIILNSPCNPTGATYDESVIKSVAQTAEDHDIFVISDEVYEKIVYGTKHHSVGTLIPDLAITINGFSKAYAMTGWRLGYATAPRSILQGMLKIQQHTVSNATSFVQRAGIEALSGDQGALRTMVAEFQIRRDLIINGLARIGIKCALPKGAFYAFPKIAEFGTSEQVTEQLLRDALVAVTPGSAFGPNGEGYVRLSYATSREDITKGIDRIEEALR